MEKVGEGWIKFEKVPREFIFGSFVKLEKVGEGWRRLEILLFY